MNKNNLNTMKKYKTTCLYWKSNISNDLFIKYVNYTSKTLEPNLISLILKLWADVSLMEN